MTDVPSAELLERYRQHDQSAAEELFNRYAERLTRLARARLSRPFAGRLDPEDVVHSAYRSFFRLALTKDLQLEEPAALWRLLVRITLRKLQRNVRRHQADCRDVRREQPWPEASDEALAPALSSRQPTAEQAAALSDEIRHLLSPLSEQQRRIVQLRLEGCEIDEIARRLQRSARTVRRCLAGLQRYLQEGLQESSSDPAIPAVGHLIAYGDILLQRQLGQGGMGKVYKAQLRGLSAPVAVKLIRKPLRQHPQAVSRFLQEVAVLARLRHPGIVAVHGLGQLPDGGHFLVMDLIEGGNLAERMARGPVPVAAALEWVYQAALAIQHAHEQGIIHCDLKPSNLLLDYAGQIHVTDFGLARLLLDDHETPRCAGTPGFMAPEQYEPFAEISSRTDVHGLAAVLYSLLTGRPPFTADSPSESDLFPATPPAPLTTLRADVPLSVEQLCRRCLAADPGHRPASARDLAVELRSLAAFTTAPAGQTARAAPREPSR